MSFLKCEDEAISLPKKYSSDSLLWEPLCVPASVQGPPWEKLMSDNCYTYQVPFTITMA